LWQCMSTRDDCAWIRRCVIVSIARLLGWFHKEKVSCWSPVGFRILFPKLGQEKSISGTAQCNRTTDDGDVACSRTLSCLDIPLTIDKPFVVRTRKQMRMDIAVLPREGSQSRFLSGRPLVKHSHCNAVLEVPPTQPGVRSMPARMGGASITELSLGLSDKPRSSELSGEARLRHTSMLASAKLGALGKVRI
jgi:hypothetical protein